MKPKINILFVCMGNICRSPSAEGVFRQHAISAGLEQYFHIDSAGTHGYHVGGPPDKRSQAAALKRGIDLSHQTARGVDDGDFEYFDHILAMDQQNMTHLLSICPKHHQSKLQLMLHYAQAAGTSEVPDPYYGGVNGFEHVLDLLESASAGLLAELKLKNNL